MLDNGTKRKIDSARDILVGKLPDPKSQVEQITIALIYKFMDDMDHQSEEWGGKPTFFTGKYKKYSWSKIFDPKLGGFDRIALYSEAIIKMNQNPNLPQLFRDIFKNAYLPYRDPETLKSFLKEINEFSYDHSEQLGNAFEYLLLIMDSQGEAGQFRTPRHIIDFIVEIVAPIKNETVLDPACGTAGFLISSYKHILNANSKKSPGDKLTPDERKRLLNNFIGYDISPDMVRLSLVNLYLHGFSDPNIVEYDTLTSEERWNDTYDVLLANPPFMSPKGGIRPHKRFSIQSKRSEVLFVDYIAEHLNPGGRAGVIVPEGIIFQAQNAHKNLRKMLVENFLWAVVSLPAGVFNPYSGVKTSILLMDKALAKKTDKILFVKIANDGFDLGAQRRPNGKDDLPQSLDFVKQYHSAVSNGETLKNTGFATIVDKTKIVESGDWSLSGERYLDYSDLRVSNFELKKFNEVCTLEYGKSLPKKNRVDGDYPVMGSNGITGWHNEYLIDGPAIIVGRKGSAGEVIFIDKPCFPIDTTYYVRPIDSEKIDIKYLYHILKELNLPALKNGAGIPGLNRNDVYKTKRIPLPPLEIQKAIVAEIDVYQKIIDGARQVVDNYKPTFKIDPDWEMVSLEDYVNFHTGGTPSKKIKRFWKGAIPWVSPKDMKQDFIVDTIDHVTEEAIANSSTKLVPSNTLLCVVRSGILKHSLPISLTTKKMCFNQDIISMSFKNKKLLQKYLFYYLKIKTKFILKEGIKPGVTVQSFHNGYFKKLRIPLPDLETQNCLISELDDERAIVDSNVKLIKIYEQKIKDKIAEVWGE